MTEPASESGLEIRIDWDTCVGSGNCLFWAPESFDLGDDGHAVVLDPMATPFDRLQVAVEGCPVGAISLWRNGTHIEQGTN